MTDGPLRRSGRVRRSPKGLHDVYEHAIAAAKDLAGKELTASEENPGRSDDESEWESHEDRPGKKETRFRGGQPHTQPAGMAFRVQTPAENEQHADEQQATASHEAAGAPMVASTSDPDRPQKKAVKLSTGKPQRAASKKSKKQKYDPAPMKAVAEQAQDLLAPVSQTDTPAAADPCAALNCKPSAPVSQKAFQEQARKVLTELQQRLQTQEEDDADIDVSGLLLLEPGLDIEAGGAIVSAGSSAPAPADADEPDKGFQEELAEAGKMLRSLENRLKGRRTTKRLYYRAPPADAGEAAALIAAGEDWLSSEDILITVGVLRYSQFTCLQEFNVLPRQPLTVLRDLLSCPADSYLGTLGMAVPGAYFYIEGTFYNDVRQPEALDYSEPVLRFCGEHNLQPPRPPLEASCEACWRPLSFQQQDGSNEQPVGTYKTASMHETRFSNLEHLRIGATGYVYCHQGCCEHALYIKDIRRIHPDDPQQASSYPVRTFQASYRRQKCSICVARFATKITYEDKYAPVTPGFWCTECYEAMHYDAKGKLKDSHKVFPLPVIV